jgi:protocatechuate 3,4-dioxygenase alpha subunit
MTPGQTPSQTVGPYFALGLTPRQYGINFTALFDNHLVDDDTPAPIRINGRVFDGNGAPIEDAMVEIYQADSVGAYGQSNVAGFRGFGRCGTGTDAQKRFHFFTVKPGRIDARQAPYIDVMVFMRGLLSHVYTRIYFSDEAAVNAADPVLNAVEPRRRHTLIAQRQADAQGVSYLFDIHMQGEQETVFFDV